MASDCDGDDLDSMAESWSEKGAWRMSMEIGEVIQKILIHYAPNLLMWWFILLYMLGSDKTTDGAINATMASFALIFEDYNLFNPCANAILQA